MKPQTMKYTRRLQGLGRLVLVPAALLFLVPFAHAQTDTSFPPIGGGGGGSFTARCQQGQLLTGFELRTGDDVDAIRLLCVTAYGPADVGPGAAGGLSFGGGGGGPRQLVCPKEQPIVTGIAVTAQGVATVIVDRLYLRCGIAAADQGEKRPGSVEFKEHDLNYEYTHPGKSFLGLGSRPDHVPEVNDFQDCPAGLVAVGITGRSGKWLDAVGLICGEPKLTPVVKALGRVKLPPGTAAAGPPISICETARRARARNSPAASGLEEKCRAAGVRGESPPIKALGRVKLPPGKTADPSHSISICDSAREALTRNSPAAPGLEDKCRADLAARGVAIAEMDPVVAEARASNPDAMYQQGFDIATGIFGDPALGAQGNTAAGPGSLGIRDSLSAAGQKGFNDSMALHLSRDYKP